MAGKRYLTVIVVFLTFTALFGEQRSPIPGIDIIEMAKGDPTGITKNEPTTKPNTNNPQSDPTKPEVQGEYPQIRNLTVKMDPTDSNSALISWEGAPNLDTPVYIVRYSRPITTKQMVLQAYNTTPEPVQPGTTTFLDKDIPQGSYYYAAVSTFELSSEGRVEMRGGQNYTEVPFIVGETKTTGDSCTADRERDFKDDEFQISDLVAVDTETGVVLNWKKSPVPGVRYKVFRGPEPLDAPERLEKAAALGQTTEDSPFFEDKQPDRGARIYYGVSVYDCVNQKDYPQLVLNQSYISHTYNRPERKYEYDSFLPGSLTVYMQSKDTIRLLWVDPGPSIVEYEVYRASEPIQNLDALSRAKQVGIAKPNKNGFTDSNLKPGQYFYALVPKDTTGRKIQELQAGRTFTAFGITLHGATGDPEKPGMFEETGDGRIQNLSASVEGDSVIFEWKYESGISEEDVQLFLYRSKEPIPDIESIEKTGIFLAEIPVNARRYLDRTGGDRFYYAFVESYPSKKKANVYHTPQPLGPRPQTTQENNTTEKPAQADADAKLREILGRTYAVQKHQECVDEIRNFLQQTGLPAAVIAKALFYQGQSYYFTGQYRQAKENFDRTDVRNAFPERAQFWYLRSLERTE